MSTAALACPHCGEPVPGQPPKGGRPALTPEQAQARQTKIGNAVIAAIVAVVVITVGFAVLNFETEQQRLVRRDREIKECWRAFQGIYNADLREAAERKCIEMKGWR